MIIIKEKGGNSQIYVPRSNAAIDVNNVEENKVYITEDMLYDILVNYIRENELAAQLDDKQDRLISGRNIKTINGNNILGEGNVFIETNNAIELTQAQYDALVANGTVDEDKFYVITDAKINLPFVTSTQMVEYVDDVVGQINTILEDIIN